MKIKESIVAFDPSYIPKSGKQTFGLGRYWSGIPAEQMRQIYGSLMQSVTMNMFRKRNTRTYGLVRTGNEGTNSYPYVIYNDYYAHRDFITALINSSFIGILRTHEVRSSKTGERIQFLLNCWTRIMISFVIRQPDFFF